MNLIFICTSKLFKTTGENQFLGAKSLMNLYLHFLNSRKANNDLIQWAKIFFCVPKWRNFYGAIKLFIFQILP